MKTLYLLCSRIRQYFLKNKAMFILFIIGGMVNGVMLTYCYGNLLTLITTRESQDYKYRQYTVQFSMGDFEPEQLEKLYTNPNVYFARILHKHYIFPDHSKPEEHVVMFTPYVENLPLYSVTDPTATQGRVYQGASELNGPYEMLSPAKIDENRWTPGQFYGFLGKRFESVGTCISVLKDTYIIPLETFYELELNKDVHLAYIYTRERTDFESGIDPMETFLQETFPGCRFVGTPKDSYAITIRETLKTFPLIVVCYLIASISYVFLLRYIVDSTMKESIISVIVGAPKSTITLTIFWEATLMSLLSNGLGLLIHRLLYKPIFQNLNVDKSLNYYAADYLYIFLIAFIITLIVIAPFVIKYMKLSPIAARRAKE